MVIYKILWLYTKYYSYIKYCGNPISPFKREIFCEINLMWFSGTHESAHLMWFGGTHREYGYSKQYRTLVYITDLYTLIYSIALYSLILIYLYSYTSAAFYTLSYIYSYILPRIFYTTLICLLYTLLYTYYYILPCIFLYILSTLLYTLSLIL